MVNRRSSTADPPGSPDVSKVKPDLNCINFDNALLVCVATVVGVLPRSINPAARTVENLSVPTIFLSDPAGFRRFLQFSTGSLLTDFCRIFQKNFGHFRVGLHLGLCGNHRNRQEFAGFV